MTLLRLLFVGHIDMVEIKSNRTIPGEFIIKLLTFTRTNIFVSFINKYYLGEIVKWYCDASETQILIDINIHIHNNICDK